MPSISSVARPSVQSSLAPICSTASGYGARTGGSTLAHKLRLAHDLFTDMGIRGFAERTRHELSATGHTVRVRAVGSFDELTAQEAQVARLAASGRTNPEIGAQMFISPRTVEYHLGKVFPKLGVTSRRDLQSVLPRHDR